MPSTSYVSLISLPPLLKSAQAHASLQGFLFYNRKGETEQKPLKKTVQEPTPSSYSGFVMVLLCYSSDTLALSVSISSADVFVENSSNLKSIDSTHQTE